MAKLIILTTIAESDLEGITDYLIENWGISVCEKFISRFENVCDLIAASPHVYPLIHKKKKIRKCVLTRQNTIYYRENGHQIEIISIFDSRMDPDKLSNLLEI